MSDSHYYHNLFSDKAEMKEPTKEILHEGKSISLNKVNKTKSSRILKFH